MEQNKRIFLVNWKSIVFFLMFGVLVPLISCYFLFWYKEWTKIPIKNQATSDGSVLVTLVDDNDSIKNFVGVVRAAFQAPFDLSLYNICLENQTVAKEGEKETPLRVQAVIFNEIGSAVSAPIEIGPKGKKCGVVNIKSFFLRTGAYESKENIPESKIEFNIRASDSEGASPIRNARIVSSFIFLLAYGATLKLINDYRIWAKKVFKCRKKEII